MKKLYSHTVNKTRHIIDEVKPSRVFQALNDDNQLETLYYLPQLPATFLFESQLKSNNIFTSLEALMQSIDEQPKKDLKESLLEVIFNEYRGIINKEAVTIELSKEDVTLSYVYFRHNSKSTGVIILKSPTPTNVITMLKGTHIERAIVGEYLCKFYSNPQMNITWSAENEYSDFSREIAFYLNGKKLSVYRLDDTPAHEIERVSSLLKKSLKKHQSEISREVTVDEVAEILTTKLKSIYPPMNTFAEQISITSGTHELIVVEFRSKFNRREYTKFIAIRNGNGLRSIESLCEEFILEFTRLFTIESAVTDFVKEKYPKAKINVSLYDNNLNLTITAANVVRRRTNITNKNADYVIDWVKKVAELVKE